MKNCIYPGSFDPFTKGHMDIVKRGAELFDQIIIGVLHNREKKTLFSVEERVHWIQRCAQEAQLGERVSVKAFSGMTVDFAAENDAEFILRGLRSIGDFEYERQIANANKEMQSLETVFLLTDYRYAHISATIVRDVGMYGRDISAWVPTAIAREVGERLAALGR